MSEKYVTDYLVKNAAELGSSDFLICADRTLGWQELLDESKKIAAHINRKLDDQQQKIISILLSDSWQFVVAYFGIVLSGNIALPIDITFKKLEVDSVIGSVTTAMIIANKESQHLTDNPVVLIEDILQGPTVEFKSDYQLPPSKQIATLFLSSGTTGKPKAIPNTHTNQLWDVAAIAKPLKWTKSDSLLITLHLSHRHGLVICLLSAVYHGNKVYLEERFNADRVLELLESGKISVYSCVPAVYEKLVEHRPDKKYDLSGVRLFASSSSLLPPYLHKAFKERFGKSIVDRYGTSETGSIAVKSDATGDLFEELEGVELRIEQGGEIALKSPGLFPGYYDNPEATRKSMSKDGWWLTGDIGETNAKRVELKGRSKERINKTGYSIYPQDIEWALKQHSGVSEVKIVSRSQPRKLDDTVIAFFSGQVNVEELEQYSKLNLPRSWRPDLFINVEGLPKTHSGKPSLTKLNDMLDSKYGHLLRGANE